MMVVHGRNFGNRCMKTKYSLRFFLISALALGIACAMSLEYFLHRPVEIKTVVMGPVTTGTSTTEYLTMDELRFAVIRAASDDSVEFGTIENAKIEEHRSTVEPARNVALLGMAEIHRTIFKCTTLCRQNDGSLERKIFLVEKNHFHMME